MGCLLDPSWLHSSLSGKDKMASEGEEKWCPKMKAESSVDQGGSWEINKRARGRGRGRAQSGKVMASEGC